MVKVVRPFALVDNAGSSAHFGDPKESMSINRNTTRDMRATQRRIFVSMGSCMAAPK